MPESFRRAERVKGSKGSKGAKTQPWSDADTPSEETPEPSDSAPSTPSSPPPEPDYLREQWEQLLRRNWGENTRKSLALIRAIASQKAAAERSRSSPSAPEIFVLSADTIFLALLHEAAGERDRSLQDFPSGGLARMLAQRSQLSAQELRERLETGVLRPISGDPGTSGNVQLMPEKLQAAIKRAEKLSDDISGDHLIATRHLLAAFLYSDQPSIPPPGLNLEAVRLTRSQLVHDFRTLIQTSTAVSPGEKREAWEPILQQILGEEPAPAPEDPPPIELGSKFGATRRSQEIELCLDIDAYAQAIAKTFISAAEEDDFVFALYGPWGRGKTTLIERVKQYLAGERGEKPAKDYVAVNFSAWKYPTRPEVWVHLYQTIAAKAQAGGFWQKLRVGFRAGLLKNGWLSLLVGLGLLAVSRFQLNFAEWLFAGLGLAGILILGSFVWNAIKLGQQFAHYFSMPDHASKLGLQAVMGSDLKTLLRVWIRRDASLAGEAAQGGPLRSPVAKAIDEEDGNRACDFSPWSRAWGARLGVILLIWLTLAGVAWKVHHEVAAGETAHAKKANHKLEALDPFAQRVPDGTPLSGYATVLDPAGSSDVPSEQPLRFDLNLQAKDVKLRWSGTTAPLPPTELVPAATKPPEKGKVLGLPGEVIFLDGLLLVLAVATPILVFAITAAPQQHDRVLLVVDDLDRCEPEQMLAVIESLRLFLDDEEMSRRMQVAMLIDRAILRRAILQKAEKAGILEEFPSPDDFFRNQEEKFFVAGLTLPALNPEQTNDLAERIVKKEYEAQQESEVATDDSKGAAVPGGGETVAPASPTDGKPPEDSTAVTQVGATAPGEPLPPPAVAAPEQVGESKPVEPITFSKGERELLLATIKEIPQGQKLTPRALRAFVLRYQLLRLLLGYLEQRPEPALIISALAARTIGGPAINTADLSREALAALDSIVGSDGTTNESPAATGAA